MARYTFKLPDVGEGTAEVEITGWMVKVGDVVEEDQPIADVMTDKATMELPAPVGGRIVELHGEVGERRAVGSALAVIETDAEAVQESETRADPEEAAPAAVPAVPAPPRPAPIAEPASAPRQPVAARPAAPSGASSRSFGEKPIASPAVRRLAWELGIELQFVPGTGPAGRITREDVEAYRDAQGGPSSARGTSRRAPRTGVEEVKVVGLRRVIAERMQAAKRQIPHFSYIEEIDVTALEDLRVALNAEAQPGAARLTLLPFLVRALAVALPGWPQINARFDDEAGIVTHHAGVHVGIATQTKGGLVVPVLRHAESLTLRESAAEIARLAGAAREGSATPTELGGSTITITSLGALGGLATTPVINRPEVAIVGVNKIVERPVVRGGAIAIRKMMNLSSSFDHRVVDGWDAAEFVQRLRVLLEQPALLFAEGE
ncbi:dihydrolipoamide acetyltransferase family protein [Enterovirga rhinocerotis]|uniref:Dihydrolipoamide acetyltransferase component of pyruvate dehydrogenase complex n=1 Tax=Enterovirga rhinocerotis TaxID=1339210 RepID=A0A4R7C870_9HYPH|nr:dihydrolipoamide acetyltransferase family protein [Enterovirga rhinocerotis]TDR93036.1 2-oxoisovalerate dehydrogenase E2 component (dihydrolipoyl transacylase) [Enterovirga rhinocerotis]